MLIIFFTQLFHKYMLTHEQQKNIKITNTYLFQILSERLTLNNISQFKKILGKQIKSKPRHMLMPIHRKEEKHWALAIFYNIHLTESQSHDDINQSTEPCIMYLDSLSMIDETVSNYLMAIGKELTGRSSMAMFNYRMSVPQQKNNFDCGLYVLEYIERFIAKPESLFNLGLILYQNEENLEALLSRAYFEVELRKDFVEFQKFIEGLQKSDPKMKDIVLDAITQRYQRSELWFNTFAMNNKRKDLLMLISNLNRAKNDENEIRKCVTEYRKSRKL